MPPQIQFLESVFERLKDADSENAGNLYGIMYEGKTLIVGFSFDTDIGAPTDSTKSYFDAAQVLFPTGIDFIGIIMVGCECIVPGLDTICPQILVRLKDVNVTNNPVFLSKNLNDSEVEVCYLQDERLYRTEYTQITYTEFKENFIYLRLIGGVSTVVEYATNLDHHPEMEELSARIARGMIFRVSITDIYIYKMNLFHILTSTIGKVYDRLTKSKDFSTEMEVLNIYAYFPSSLSIKEGRTYSAPYLVDEAHDDGDDKYVLSYYHSEDDLRLVIGLPFDGLCVVYRERTLDDIYTLLIDAAERTIFLIETHLSRYLDDPEKLRKLKAFHFFNNVLCHPLSFFYLSDETDEELVDLRKSIHRYLNLPMDKPYFRRGNSLKFFNPLKEKIEVLLNVHEGVWLLPSRINDNLRAFVRGKYGYYHYMMGGMNDKGWGCAYRSLQTIFSWFRMQGYTDLEIPTHAEIQKELVKIGDKEESFVGSKTWIGSTEVAFVLDSMLKINSRILNVSSGSEMLSTLPVLLEHFQTHGTPVMIGGGVLAHTIVGVSMDEKTGAGCFLIVDPHYTGENDLLYIQRRTYVGWKGLNFWETTSFYNLCLPQRPICF